jgi:DNA-binding beta-propeller fold protein YncE
MHKKLLLSAVIAALCVTTSANAANGFLAEHQWTFNHTAANGSKSMGSEIVTYDATNNRLWVIGTNVQKINNNGESGIDILDLKGNLVHSIDTQSLGGVTSVAVKNNQAAVAISADTKTDLGLVRFFDADTFDKLADVTVGANPDAVTFTPNGSRLLVANEGEPSSYDSADPSGDPEGSVSVINVRTHKAKTADFSGFDSKADKLKAKGVRLTGPYATVSQDLEPEYIAVSHNGKQALVTLQEANAVAIIDIASATVTDIKPMGLKDHSLPGKGLDASDKDAGMRNIQNWKIKGMYMPDGIASFTQKGNQFYVTANEGDSRDWLGVGGKDEVRVKDIAKVKIDPSLDAQLTALHGDWKADDKLGRLTISSTSGDLDNDGDLDELQVFGARSFSILNEKGKRVFDSGDQLEQIIKGLIIAHPGEASYAALWDDTRSDNKGPEPESAVVGKVNGRDLLFLGLERSNAIMVWDLSDLEHIRFLDIMSVAGDVAPEGLSFFKNDQGSFLAVANEGSATTSLYRVSAKSDKH